LSADPERVSGRALWGDWGAIAIDEGARGLRFVLILLVLALAVLAGLFVYGQMMEPETQTIEVEANDAGN
jgi:hypothetical protein